MPTYLSLFSYTGPTWERLMRNPGDRTAAIRAAAQAVGGSVRSVHWMLGPYDGIVVFDAPASVSAAAVSVTAMSSGAFRQVQTHELFTQEQLEAVLSGASDAAAAFTPPDAAGSTD
jgi:uncharacterized protein with GYD domain